MSDLVNGKGTTIWAISSISQMQMHMSGETKNVTSKIVNPFLSACFNIKFGQVIDTVD